MKKLTIMVGSPASEELRCCWEGQFCPFVYTRKMGFIYICGLKNQELRDKDSGVEGILVPICQDLDTAS